MNTAPPRVADPAGEFPPGARASSGGSALRPELLTSWKRSEAAIGSPGNVRDVPQVGFELLDGHLLEMFQAPLARVADELDGTGLGLLLADSEGRILQRWTNDHTAAAHLDRLGTVRGAVLSEAAVGTNGVGTVAATGKSVQIAGEEHFAEFYRSAVCTGSPVLHPVTGRLLAVVTISSLLTERAELLRPLTYSIATQLGQHVLDAERPAARNVLSAFLTASRLHDGPVVAFGPDGFMMRNQRAARLTAIDLTLLQRLCGEDTRSGRVAVEFSSGHADIQLTRVDGGTGVVAVVVESERRMTQASLGPLRPALAGRSAEWLAAAQLVGRHRESRKPLVIAGEPGSGKASLALGLPHRPGSAPRATTLVDAAERHLLGAKRWLQRMAERLESGAPLIVRGIETLDASATSGLKSLIDTTQTRGAVLLTMSAEDRTTAELTAGKLGYPVAWVPALRERPGDIALLWRAIADHAAPGAHLEPTPEALATLEAHAWSGNLVELRNVIEQLAMSGRRGQIGPADLPMSVRSARSLSMIERAELEAITRALQEAGGNRSRAAEILGLSRATVYRKMKTYRLSA